MNPENYRRVHFHHIWRHSYHVVFVCLLFRAGKYQRERVWGKAKRWYWGQSLRVYYRKIKKMMANRFQLFLKIYILLNHFYMDDFFLHKSFVLLAHEKNFQSYFNLILFKWKDIFYCSPLNGRSLIRNLELFKHCCSILFFSVSHCKWVCCVPNP